MMKKLTIYLSENDPIYQQLLTTADQWAKDHKEKTGEDAYITPTQVIDTIITDAMENKKGDQEEIKKDYNKLLNQPPNKELKKLVKRADDREENLLRELKTLIHKIKLNTNIKKWGSNPDSGLLCWDNDDCEFTFAPGHTANILELIDEDYIFLTKND